MATSKVLNNPGMSFDEAKKSPSTTVSGSVSGSGSGPGTVRQGGSGQVISGSYTNCTINFSM